MTEKELKKRKYNRVLIGILVNNIKELDVKIYDYNKYMDDNNFAESNEVEQLYEEIRAIGLDLFYIGK